MGGAGEGAPAPRSPGSRRAPVADESTVRRLLRTQAPALADRPLRPGPTGWDNTHWLLGDDLAVRLPRRRLAVELVANEAACLPRVADRLPVAVPVPVHVGVPEVTDAPRAGASGAAASGAAAAEWPWPWTVVPWFAGVRADLATPSPDPLEHAAALGGFLRALHVPAPDDAPHNPYRSIPLAQRAARTGEALAVLTERGESTAVAVLREVWEHGLAAAPHRGPRTWIHGDLHPGNQVVAGGRLAAVVDWGDVAGGDPAADLATAWWTLPASAHPRFWEEYGRADAPMRARAAAWAAAIASYLLKEGPRVGDTAILAMARRTVQRLAER